MPLRYSLLSLMILGGLSSAVSIPAFAEDKIVKLDGSSTVYPISEAVAEEFQIKHRGEIKVTVGVSGTGGGFKKFCRGDIDIADASRPILKKEMDVCKENGIQYIELPVAYDALTVVVHPANNWVKTLTVTELKMMWSPESQGTITTWKQVNPAWPDNKLALFGPGADSGTFDYFTEAVNGKSKASRGDFTASEDDNVLVQGVSRDKNALGYFGFAYYIENQKRLRAVPIDSGKGPVLPSEKTVKDGTYNPLSRPIFIYVNTKSLDRPEIRDFVNFYLDHAAPLVKDAKYIPLHDQAYKLAKAHVANRKTGTVFGGVAQVGLSVDEMLKLEAK